MMINGLQPYDTTNTNNSTSSSTSTTGGLNPNDFMTLLVSEIQNQDPTQPMDPTTFMSQLVELNQLEQVTQINQAVQEYLAASTTSGSAPTTN